MKYLIMIFLFLIISCGKEDETPNGTPVDPTCKSIASYWVQDDGSGIQLNGLTFDGGIQETWGYEISNGEEIGCWYRVNILNGDEISGNIGIQDIGPAAICGGATIINGTYEYTVDCDTLTACSTNGNVGCVVYH